ncbi:MinD/ParA family ATP-binding protein [Arthrobacter sp. B2a2-09]|uniref:MinD/ParA family ATP-binding protein n=1 Tax=Arthrobacter sp. B2a2-09 TaxID=2952822 RepID=UPI0022CD5767|nr:MinD/ParA family protein [Arthrobacter sp. B2a2-09]MCZ9882363.1 MinD/ParA family protein [Arthrobacter sp. B2a2-09]
MPDSVDNEASDAASNEGQPELRRRRDRRRAEGDDAWTGTMPIITPNDSDAPASTPAPLQSRSWAEAAAAADASTETSTGTETDSTSGDASREEPIREEPRRESVTAAAPASGAFPPNAARAGRAAAANAPISDFISSPGSFVKEQKPRPIGGFRGMLYKLSGGAWNLGPSAKQREEDELALRISRQLQGSYNTAVLSLKGGIGKTSTTVGVGLTLAEFRGDPPCAIDANPDSGDLVERALGEGIYQKATPRTITDLLKNVDNVDSLTALARYMHHAGRLHLIAGEQDPEVSDSLTAEEYLRIRQLISGYYSVALTDCGTGVTHNAMSGILQSADNLIIAAGYAVSGAKRARSTLQWLASHGYEELARNAIVVITDKDEVSSRVDKDAIEEHLSGICRQLIAVPHDRGVADGDLVTLDVLRPDTRRAYKEIAAAIVDGYV